MKPVKLENRTKKSGTAPTMAARDLDEILADLNKKIEKASKIPEALKSAGREMRQIKRQSRQFLRDCLQLGAKSANNVAKSKKNVARFFGLLTVDVPSEDCRYADILPYTLRLIFNPKDKAENNKVHRYTRALLELDKQAVPVDSIAEAIKSTRGGIDQLAKERAAEKRGTTANSHSNGASGSIAGARFRFTNEELRQAIDPNTGKGVIKVEFELDELRGTFAPSVKRRSSRFGRKTPRLGRVFVGSPTSTPRTMSLYKRIGERALAAQRLSSLRGLL